VTGVTGFFSILKNLPLGLHGREEVVRLLQNDGDFLVRETTRNDEKQTVLSVMWGSPKHFIVQLSPEGLFRSVSPFFFMVLLSSYGSAPPKYRVWRKPVFKKTSGVLWSFKKVSIVVNFFPCGGIIV
jgi:hypothetical protein